MYPIQNHQNQVPVCNPYLQPQVSAVKIDIHNPKAYGGVDETGRLNPPVLPCIYDYPYAPVYNIPTTQQYNNAGVYPQPPFIMPATQQPASVPVVQTPAQEQKVAEQVVAPVVQTKDVTTNPNEKSTTTQKATIPTPVIVPVPPVPVVPAATAIPQPLVSAPITQQVNVNTTPQEQTSVQTEPAAAVTAPKENTTVAPVAPVAEQPTVETSFDVNAIVNALGSTNPDDQTAAIQKIAEVAQTDPNQAKALLNEQVFGQLVGIINADTSKLQGPTGESNPQNLSPLEKAEINKQFAIYTLAILQKNFRDEINKEMKKNNLPDIAINDLPFIKEGIVDNLKDNPNPTIREACLSALNYVGRPEDKEILKTLYEISAKHDVSPEVKKAAQDYLAKLPA